MLSGLGGDNIGQIMEMLKNARQYESKIYELLATAEDWQKTIEKEKDDFIMYGAMVANGNAFIYVMQMRIINGLPTMIKEVKRFSLKELIEQAKKFIPE